MRFKKGNRWRGSKGQVRYKTWRRNVFQLNKGRYGLYLKYNSKFLFIPKGFAHGFLGLGKENIVLYSCTNYRHAQSEKAILWNDKDLKIKWGIKKPIISKKDRSAQKFQDIKF